MYTGGGTGSIAEGLATQQWWTTQPGSEDSFIRI